MISPREQAEEAAAQWDARLRGSKATTRDCAAFHAWLRESPEHQVAHDRLQTALATLQANAALPELSALRDEARNGIHQGRIRRWMPMIAAVAAVLILALVIVPRAPRGDTIYATSSDERTSVTLADGSVITLDASTRVSVRLGKLRRDVTLLAGRALFQVAKDRQRPFVVKAGDRTITALGTKFDVRLSPDELRVTLAEGSVAVAPVQPGHGAVRQIMKPQQQLVEVANAVTPQLRDIDADKALSWVDGRVFFDNEPLASAVEEMNQYSKRQIVVDPGVADLRINGMFRTGNQAGFIEGVQLALPVEVHGDDQGRLVISRR